MTLHSVEKRSHLLPALAISLALHLLLLWAPPLARRGGDAAAPLVATLRPVLPPLQGRQTPESTTPANPPPAAPAAAAVPEMVSSPQKVSVGETPIAAATPDSTATTPDRSDIFSGGAASPAPVPVAVGPAGDGLDPDGLRGYRLALAREARRFKRYPAEALAADLGGTVELRVAIASPGLPPVVQLVVSSGVPSLDEAALDMLRQALAATPLPESLRRQAFNISLPIVFELPD